MTLIPAVVEAPESALGHRPAPAVFAKHQPHLEVLEPLRFLHHQEADRDGETQPPLPVRHPRQHRLQVHAGVQRAPRRA